MIMSLQGAIATKQSHRLKWIRVIASLALQPLPLWLAGAMTCVLVFSSCAVRNAATAITADILTRGMVEVETEEDIFVAKEAALPLLKVVEVLHRGDPANRGFLSLLAKVYGNYAFGFAEAEVLKLSSLQDGKLSELKTDEWKKRVKRFYAKGRDYGIAALSRGKQTIADKPLPQFEKYLKKFGKKDTETLFWTAFDWGSYINMSRDDIAATADLPRVQAMVDRVLVINPEFQCGVTYAFKGALLAGNPFLTGSKPEAARPYFDKALSACNGAYLMTKVMYAEWYLKTIGDKAAFRKALEDVVSADAAALPNQRLANELAQERAGLLLR